MTASEIIQIVISIFSFAATIAVSVIIYKFERKNEKLREEEIKRQKTREVELIAKNFIIDNQNEIELLPLSVISQCLHEYDNNIRSIYTKFKKCDLEVQNEILRQEKSPIGLINNGDWLDIVLFKFKEIEQQYKLATKSLLYDGCKYLHRAYERYRKEQIEEIDPFCFVVPGYENRLRMMNGKEFINSNFYSYTEPYLAGVYKEINNISKGSAIFPTQPPMDVLFERFDLGMCDEGLVCFWIMKYIITVCEILYDHELTGVQKEAWREYSFDESKIETYEDMYYYTLFVMYKTLFNG